MTQILYLVGVVVALLQFGCNSGCGNAGANVFYPATNGGATVDIGNGTIVLNTAGCDDPRKVYCFHEEFENVINTCSPSGPYFNGLASGAGATCSSGTPLDGHPGIWYGQTGTTATGTAHFATGLTTFTFGGNFGQACVAELVYIPTLSTTVIEFIARIGWIDSGSAADSTDAVETIYDRASKGNFWALETRSNAGTPTVVACDGTNGTTSAPVQAATWTTLMQCVDSDGLTARQYVNGVQCATTTSTIPVGSSRSFGIGGQVLNNSGSSPASESMLVDYVAAVIPFTVPR